MQQEFIVYKSNTEQEIESQKNRIRSYETQLKESEYKRVQQEKYLNEEISILQQRLKNEIHTFKEYNRDLSKGNDECNIQIESLKETLNILDEETYQKASQIKNMKF